MTESTASQTQQFKDAFRKAVSDAEPFDHVDKTGVARTTDHAAIAYIRVSHTQPGAILDISGTKARIRP